MLCWFAPQAPLAGEYHLLFLDWWDRARRQGAVIGELLLQHGVTPAEARSRRTTRDYDAIVRDRVAPDNRTVEINLFMLREQENGWAATVHSGTCRALQRHKLTSALTSVGFTDAEWLDPDESGYYQPIVVARG